MAYDAPLPWSGAALPDLTTDQVWEADVVKNYFELIDAAGATDRGAIGTLQGDVSDWTDYVPTLTNLAVGNGAQTAKWRRRGKMIDVFYGLQFGTTSTIGSGVGVSIPVAAATWFDNGNPRILPGGGMLQDVSATNLGYYTATLRFLGGQIQVGYQETSTNSARFGPASNTAPFIWSNAAGNLDRLSFLVTIPIA